MKKSFGVCVDDISYIHNSKGLTFDAGKYDINVYTNGIGPND